MVVVGLSLLDWRDCLAIVGEMLRVVKHEERSCLLAGIDIDRSKRIKPDVMVAYRQNDGH